LAVEVETPPELPAVIPSEEVDTHLVDVPVFIRTRPKESVVLKESVNDPESLSPPLKYVFPTISAMNPVVEVAEAPSTKTSEVSVG